MALRGEHFDGHEFAAAAAARGASGLLVERELPIDLPQIVVPDTLGALTACARAQRRSFHGPVVAITGSNGKTTTKEMIGAILGDRGPCLVTRGNLNNHIGVPLTLLALVAGHRYAVMEMGANHRGEIAHLASSGGARHWIVTNAGAAHLEGFGSLDGVAEGKGELFAGLAGGWNRGLERRRSLRVALAVARGRPPRGDVRVGGTPTFRPVTFARSLDAGTPRLEFELVAPVGRRGVSLRWRTCTTCGTRWAQRRRAGGGRVARRCRAAWPAAMKAVKGRLEFKPAIGGAVLVDDSYNANPGSFARGLDAFRRFRADAVAGPGRHDGARTLGGRTASRSRPIRQGDRDCAAPGVRTQARMRRPTRSAPAACWFEQDRGSDRRSAPQPAPPTSSSWSKGRAQTGWSV